MKKLFFLPLLLPGALAGHARHLSGKQVPAAVRQGFQQAFPGAKAVHWEQEAPNYEAGFTRQGVETVAVFTPAGALVETETVIPAHRLPVLAKTVLLQRYQGYKVTETARIVSAAGTTTYEAEVRQGGRHEDVLFDENGRLLKKP